MKVIRYKSHHDVSNVVEGQLKRKLATPLAIKKVFKSEPENKKAGIYVHTPFCDKICSFCNMNRKQITGSLKEYSDYLVKEFKKYGNYPYMQKKEIEVVFFGGGTPTTYKPQELENILASLRENFKFSDNYEFTFETTLHNLTLEKLQIMQKYGVNRLSVGIQTFSNRGRKILNRTYDQETIVKRLKELKEKFNGLLCIDIIYNYPDQTIEELEEDARLLCEIGVDSSSFYSLMIQEGSALSKDRNSDKIEFKYNLEKDKMLHDKFLEITGKNGYEVLELTKISNGRDKYKYIEFVHNLNDLIPIGVGACGRVAGIECYHLNKLISFYAKSDDLKLRIKKLSGVMQYRETSLEKIKEIIGKDYEAVLKLLEKYQEDKMVEIKNNVVNYTDDGVFWGNTIIAEICKEIIKINK